MDCEKCDRPFKDGDALVVIQDATWRAFEDGWDSDDGEVDLDESIGSITYHASCYRELKNA